MRWEVRLLENDERMKDATRGGGGGGEEAWTKWRAHDRLIDSGHSLQFHFQFQFSKRRRSSASCQCRVTATATGTGTAHAKRTARAVWLRIERLKCGIID